MPLDDYDMPQKPFQIVFEYYLKHYRVDLEKDIIESIRKTIENIANESLKAKIKDCLSSEEATTLEKIKTLAYTLGAMDGRYVTNIGARLYLTGGFWVSLQVWRFKPEYN